MNRKSRWWPIQNMAITQKLMKKATNLAVDLGDEGPDSCPGPGLGMSSTSSVIEIANTASENRAQTLQRHGAMLMRVRLRVGRLLAHRSVLVHASTACTR